MLTYDLPILIQEKIHKPAPSVDTFHTIEDLVHKTLSGKNIENSSSSRKKTSRMKNLPRKHKFKLLQNSKIISKSRKKVGKVIPVHSILKNSSRGAVKKANKKPKTIGDSTTKPCQSPKHVSFSGKDDVIGHNENCPNINLPQFQSLCKIFSRVLAASSDLENSREVDSLSVPTDVHVGNISSKNVVTSGSEGIIGSLLEKEQSSVSSDRDIPIYIHSDNERCSTAERSSSTLHVDLNHSVQAYSDQDRIRPGASEVPSDSHIGEPRIPNSSYSEGSSSHSVIHLEETFPRPSDACRVPTSSGMLLSVSNTTDSQAIVKRQYHSTSCIEQNEKQLQPPVWPTFDSCFHNLDYHPKHPLSSKDLIGSMSSSVVSRLTSQPVPTCKKKHVAEDYVGLPLNSQGELIHLHSGAKFGIGDVFKQQNAVQSSTHSLRVPNSTESRVTIGDAETMKWKFSGAAISGLQGQYYHVSKPETSGFAFTRGSERREVQNYEPLKSNGRLFYHGVNPKQVSYHEHREDDSTLNYIDMVKFQVEGHLDHVPQPAVRQTMRLMGKNVTVGQSSKEHQAHDDGRIWTDKEVISDNSHSVRASNIPLPKQWSQQEWVAPRPTFRTSKDNFCWALETPTNLSHNPGMESTVGLVHTDYQPQWISNNCVFSSTEDASLKVDLFSHRRPSQLLNKTSSSTVFSNLGATSVNMGYQMAMKSNPPPTYHNMLSSSTHWKHGKDIPYSTSSTFNVPFPCCNNQRFSQPSAMYSAPNLSEWLLTPKQQKLNLETLGSSHPNTFSSCQSYSLSSSNFFTPPASSTIPFSVYSTNNSQQCLSTNPALVQPSSVPLPTTNKSNSVVKDVYRSKNKGRERGGLNFTYLKGSDNAGETRKRPAAEDDVFMRPAKKPLSREEMNASAGPKEGDQMHRYTQNKKKGTGISTHEMVNATEGFRFSSASSSLKLDGNSRSGPIKLSAGAKHILKPSQAIGPEEARPTHSTLPLSFGDTSCRTLESQKKPAEVYRF
ncbi:uncharacterized protein M6B38_107115 [Iris pallida]|uniref:Uncharacterized protein n=1 Tax=Iris pallida TaxID=29817 RepID=A0AAX6ES98_IRIPA|nr:uncharacterized protein M6B38_107115 [Iris pallida]